MYDDYLTDFHWRLLHTLRHTQRRLMRPAPTRYVTVDLCIDISERMVRNYLRDLECAGMVNRPNGPKSGWAVVRRL